MKRYKLASTVLIMGLLSSAVLTQSVMADEWNKKTEITFSAPVEIPGVHLTGWSILPAGTYVFKIMDSQSDRHIVQIFNKDQTIVYATIMAIPNYRLQPTDRTVITFRERPSGQPEALRAWFYPGRNWGEEFVYPKAKALELAKATNTPVLFTAVDLPTEVAEPIRSADAPVIAELKSAPVMAIQPSGEEVQIAQVVNPPPSVVQAQVAPAVPTARTLPVTASSLPLIEILGLVSLCGALAVRAAAKHL